MIDLIPELTRARASISGPGTWVKHTMSTKDQTAHCALGACFYGANPGVFYRLVDELGNTLRARPVLPKAIWGPGNAKPQPWEHCGSNSIMVAQFNNSTDQQQVLELFDETIDRLKSKRTQPAVDALKRNACGQDGGGEPIDRAAQVAFA
jgi:hypothetical protein